MVALSSSNAGGQWALEWKEESRAVSRVVYRCMEGITLGRFSEISGVLSKGAKFLPGAAEGWGWVQTLSIN